jgi:hypothetical protein
VGNILLQKEKKLCIVSKAGVRRAKSPGAIQWADW